MRVIVRIFFGLMLLAVALGAASAVSELSYLLSSNARFASCGTLRGACDLEHMVALVVTFVATIVCAAGAIACFGSAYEAWRSHAYRGRRSYRYAGRR